MKDEVRKMDWATYQDWTKTTAVYPEEKEEEYLICQVSFFQTSEKNGEDHLTCQVPYLHLVSSIEEELRKYKDKVKGWENASSTKCWLREVCWRRMIGKMVNCQAII